MKRVLIILGLLLVISTSTYCVFTKLVSKTGNIETKESSAVFVDNTEFLTKIQVLDSSITSVDKTTDLNRVTSIPSVSFTDDNLFSTSSSSLPIYVWVDNGVINYYTGADNVDLNNGSGQQSNLLAIGDDVDYSTTLNGVTLDNWRVFYTDEDYTYLILGGMLPNTAVNITNDVDVDLDDIYGFAANNTRDDLLNLMLEKSNWNDLVTNGKIKGISINNSVNENVWAIGSPTAELWVNSWNIIYPDNKISIPISYTNLSSIAGENITLYFLNDWGYWLATPQANNERGINAVYSADKAIGNPSYDDDWYALRPVIKLPTSLFNS